MNTAAAPEIPGLEYIQPLGSGGYADVYLYQQQMPRMRVAVKVLRQEGLTPALRQQFVHEADLMAQLMDHPYIVQVFQAGQAADGRPFLVMKYYPPPNLAQRSRQSRFTVEEVLRTGVQLASAVETAHRAGIIHRDIKPANVLVSQYGAPGLTDFGIAGRGASLDEPDDDVGVSVPWAPPEVLFGHSNGDRTSDVYSLAATLWQLLVGRSPFEVPGGDNSATALMPRIRSNPPPSTGRADVPVALERLLAQAMAKEPGQRPQTALELARGLQHIELEHRYPRTQIVVLDEAGQVPVVDAVSGDGAVLADEAVSAAGGVRDGVLHIDDATLAREGHPPLSGGRTIPPAAPVPIASGVVPVGPRGQQLAPTDPEEEIETRLVARPAAQAQPYRAPAQQHPAQPHPAQPHPAPAPPYAAQPYSPPPPAGSPFPAAAPTSPTPHAVASWQAGGEPTTYPAPPSPFDQGPGPVVETQGPVGRSKRLFWVVIGLVMIIALLVIIITLVG
ncbi:serine/threonine-protein kinase [Kribbia dieselivorans]|uniref:serine/threonine-protein kinase n=1 Tax=Kribbia dieselivorans TaxID=331526 RepID=UPI0009FAAE8F|nr:serine/threonine-protein kinase [Kribbia dieselivorans]